MNNLLTLVLTKQNDSPFMIEKVPFKKENNYIIFEYEKTKYNIDLEKQVFQRENDEFLFELDFINKKSIYKLKRENLILDIKVEKCEFLQKGDSISIKYVIESDTSEININIKFIKEA